MRTAPAIPIGIRYTKPSRNIPKIATINEICDPEPGWEKYIERALPYAEKYNVRIRITSYNVCYTKLLRNGPSRQAADRTSRRAASICPPKPGKGWGNSQYGWSAVRNR